MEKGGLGEALRRAGVKRETALGFADEMRVGLRGTVGGVWDRRGVKVRQRARTVSGWMCLVCVVDGGRGSLLWSWIDSMKSDRIAASVNGLRRVTGVEALVWDGALGHRSRLVEAVGLPTVAQPAYSPELNPAERVFEEVGRWVDGRFYESVYERVGAVNAYLRRLESGPGRVRSLAGWDWIEEAVQSLQSCRAVSSE